MFSFRLTKKVASRLQPTLIETTEPPSTMLGDWYVNLCIIRRQHLLMLVSEQTLLPVLIPAKDLQNFPNRFHVALTSMLDSLGIRQERIETELKQMEKWDFAKTDSRQVLGSMNDFAHMLDTYIDRGEKLETLALKLAESPCSPIGMASPINATRALLAGIPSRV